MLDKLNYVEDPELQAAIATIRAKCASCCDLLTAAQLSRWGAE